MKQLIMNVLEDMSSGQVNLDSEGARKNIANTIIAAIKSNGGKYGKGWVLDLSTLDKKPKLTPEEAHTMPEGLKRAKELSQQAIEEGMRRTKNDMQLEHEDKVFDTAGEEVEPINTYFTADVKDERDLEEDIPGGFTTRGPSDIGGDTGTDADFNLSASEEIDGMYTDDEVKGWEAAVKETETLVDKSVEDFERNKLSEEIVDDKDAEYIYESPDGGETVYRREFGSDERVKIKIEEMEK